MHEKNAKPEGISQNPQCIDIAQAFDAFEDTALLKKQRSYVPFLFNQRRSYYLSPLSYPRLTGNRNVNYGMMYH